MWLYSDAYIIMQKLEGACESGENIVGVVSYHVSQEARATPIETSAMNVSSFTFCEDKRGDIYTSRGGAQDIHPDLLSPVDFCHLKIIIII